MTTLRDEAPEPVDDVQPMSATFADIALALHEADGAEETVDMIVDYAQTALGGDGAGVLLIHARGRVEGIASTSPEVNRAHLLQVELKEGPCLDASADAARVYRVDDAVTDQQWPQWCAKLAELGLRSVISAPLATRTRRYGSINVYAERPQAFDPDDEAVAMILARHASVALASSHNIDGLRSAVDARKVIGIAMGLLMARYDVESQTAFDVLCRYSQDHNIKLRDVAERIVAERGLPESW